jgi:CheY-like chemotaxis protein
MHVTCVKDDSEAVALLHKAAAERRPFDVVILDEPSSGLEGTVLARTIKADPLLCSVPLVVVTSFGQRGDAKAAQEAGVAAYLTRPIHQSALRRCLATLLNAAHNPSAGETGFSRPLITRHSLQEQSHRDRPRVLVVDDHELNQMVAVALLERLGCRVDVAGNGKAAVAAVTATPYDLVFMDCQMSDMDGYQATAMIRSGEGRRPRVPIVALTGRAQPGERESCLAAGMDDYLTKPLQYGHLDTFLRRWVKRETDAAR